MVAGSRAERQRHIHSISKCNDENLACADYLPMVVWPARQSCSSDLFCSAALITSSFVTTNSRRGWWSWIEQVLIMRLTWHFYITCQVRSWRSKQFMNVILQTLIDWFPYTVKEFQLTIPLARSWIWRSVTIRLCHNKKKLMIKVLEAGYT